MRRICAFISLFMLAAWTGAHPLHLSITNITYENGKLSILMKTFPDDWITAYFHYHGRVAELGEDPLGEQSWYGTYLKERFRLSVNQEGPGLPVRIGQVTVEPDAMIIEMECPLPAMPNSLYIYNALLTDIYPDQTNLVIFGYRNRETGIKFDVFKLDAEVILEGLDEEIE